MEESLLEKFVLTDFTVFCLYFNCFKQYKHYRDANVSKNLKKKKLFLRQGGKKNEYYFAFPRLKVKIKRQFKKFHFLPVFSRRWKREIISHM